MKNFLMMHGGAPTAVINASLYGSISALHSSGFTGRILAARFGTGGLLRHDIIDLTDVPMSECSRLMTTPGSAIGTGRDHLEPEDYQKMKDILLSLDVDYVLLTGGNGTMDTARKLADACHDSGITVCGVPKTMDNDLSGTYVSPGYLSAAEYIAGSVREAGEDLRGLPIHAVVIETFGRNAGWITAASCAASPDMILLPEVPFDEDRFLARVKEIHEKKGGVLIVASEGLRYADGTPIVEPVFQKDRSTYFGDVSSHLSLLIIRKLGIKARSEKPGILGRASMKWQSEEDVKAAFRAGEASAQAALKGLNGHMSILDKDLNALVVPITDDILRERTLPAAFIGQDFDVSDEFRKWFASFSHPQEPAFISFVNEEEYNG